MSSHFPPVPIAATRQADHTRGCRWLLFAIALTVQGCAATPPRPLVGPDAADPDVRVPPAIYRSALGDFSNVRPSEPVPWSNRDGSGPQQPKKDGP
jgi:hypothetical protein